MTEAAVERKLVKSATRVIEVLELFDQEQRPMQVAEVAEHYGWPASSTSRPAVPSVIACMPRPPSCASGSSTMTCR